MEEQIFMSAFIMKILIQITIETFINDKYKILKWYKNIVVIRFFLTILILPYNIGMYQNSNRKKDGWLTAPLIY